MLLDVLHSLELRTENVVGLCYDGASNMTSKVKGVATRMREVSPKAIYVHC